MNLRLNGFPDLNSLSRINNLMKNMENEMKEKRQLGAQEILFYAMNEASPKHFLMAAEVLGYTDLQAWPAAVEKLRELHPLLNVSITKENDNLIFTPAAEVATILETKVLPPAFDLAEAVEEELEKGFRSDQGPLVRITLFHRPEISMVIVAAHHSVSDAWSSVYLIGDLLRLLSEESISAYAPQPSVDEFLGYTNDGLAAKINRQITPGEPLLHEFTRQHPQAKAEILHFSAELTSLLVKTAKSQNTTVHGALQAAAALAIARLSFPAERPAYIMSPFSVRKEMNVARDFGLFIDTKIVAVETDAQKGFWNIARTAAKELSDVHTPAFLKTSAEQLRGLIGYSDDLIQFIKDNFNFDIMLSNLGRLETPESGLKLNYYAGPFIISGFNHQQAIGAVTTNGTLVLTNSSRYPVQGLLRSMESLIRSACTNN